MLIIAIVAIPLALYAGTEYILAEQPPAPTAFASFELVESNWNSYEYGFFESKSGTCNSDKYVDSPRIKSFENSEGVEELAQVLVEDAEDELGKAYLIFNYVAHNIEYIPYTNTWRNPAEVLKTMDGDCTDMSILMVSLMKSAGMEAYVAYGGESETEAQHAWVVASVEGVWFELDPTSTDFYYVYKCKKDVECGNERYYNSVLGLFGPEVALECN